MLVATPPHIETARMGDWMDKEKGGHNKDRRKMP